MKIALINTLTTGGAANACIRLHKGLLNQGIASELIYWSPKEDIPSSVYYYDEYQEKVLRKINDRTPMQKGVRKIKTLFKDDWEIMTIRDRAIHNQISNKRPEGYEVFSFPYSPYPVHKHPLVQNADLIHLHWINNFIDYSSFFKHIDQPIVWTLHEMNPFTGGCSYDYGCGKYLDNCSPCPQILGTDYENYASQILQTKIESLQNKNITVVAPSKWLMNISKKSKVLGMFNHTHIPYGINDEVFKPMNRVWLKEQYGIEHGKKVLLFVAASVSNKRKGIDMLYEAMKIISKNRDDIKAVAVGSVSIEESPNVIYTGMVKDENEMAKIYSGADLYIIPSLEDNLPNTVIESLMCGTPVVGFSKGGIPEMIQPGVNGEICDEVNSNHLSLTIMQAIDKAYDRKKIVEDARKKYSEHVQANAYIDLYQDLLNEYESSKS